MWETLIVALVVATVTLLALRSIFKTLTGKNETGPCGGNCACCTCPAVKKTNQQNKGE